MKLDYDSKYHNVKEVTFRTKNIWMKYPICSSNSNWRLKKAFSGSWSFFGHHFCPSKNFKSIVLIKNGLLAQKECRICQISSLVYWKSETSKMKDQIIPKNFLVGAPKSVFKSFCLLILEKLQVGRFWYIMVRGINFSRTVILILKMNVLFKEIETIISTAVKLLLDQHEHV